jgi:iron complex outermembrane recepter protein
LPSRCKTYSQPAARPTLPLTDSRDPRVLDRERHAPTAGILAAGLIGLAGLLTPAETAAAEPSRPFNIPAQPLGDALVDFGLQAGVSVGAGDLSLCSPQSRPVIGAYTPQRALARLLAGSRCDFRAVDAHAFSVGPIAVPTTAAAAPSQRVEPVAEGPSPVMLLDLTVTTTRRPSIVSRTPASVSLASGPSLISGRLESLQDLAPEFAGVTVTNQGPGRNKVFVRGLSDGAFTGRTQSTVGLHLDDVPITYNAPDPDLRLVDVERVELMRGPQGSLYGVGSMGGIVRIVTRKPELNRLTTGVALGGALTKSGSPSYSLDALVNAPLIADRVALRAVAYSETTGGYVDDVALAVEDANRTRRTGGRLAVTGVLSQDWQLTVGAAHQSLTSDDSQYTEGAGVLQRRIQVREPHNNRFTQASATLEGWTGWGRLRVSTAYLAHDFDTLYDASSGAPVFSDISDIRTFHQSDQVELAVAEAVLSSSTAGRLQWLAGAFVSQTRERLELNHISVEPQLLYPLYFEDRRDRIGEAAIYGEVGYALTTSLNLAVGARAFHTGLKTRSVRTFADIPIVFEGRHEAQGLSPKVVLSWQTAPTRLFYIQAAQGYRTGGFNTTGRIGQQFNAGATGNQPNRKYRPDQLWSYEAGAKASFGDRRLELRTAIFYNDWRDVQSDQFLPSGLPYTANVGRAVNTGVEGEIAVRADRALTLRLSFLANAPELRQRDTTYPARANASLPAVPRYSAALVADWRRQLRPGVVAALYGRVAYVGASILTFQEQAASTMGNYVSARLAASLEAADWRLTAFVDNPAAAEGDTFSFGDPFTQGRIGQSTPLRPRTFGLTVARGL